MLQVRASLGASQASLLQAPFGVGGDPAAFDAVRSAWIPVGELNLVRRFEPFDVNLVLTRNVGVGALGASAIVAEAVGLVINWVGDFGDRRLVTALGVNANRTRGVGQDLFTLPAEATALVAAFDNDGLGANAGVAMPLWTSGDFSVDANLAYNFNRVVIGRPVPGLPPELVTHVGLFTLRGLYGRGTAQDAAGAGPRRPRRARAGAPRPTSSTPSPPTPAAARR
jgi:hypothetical protein